jgi:hypothetical protein
MHRGRGTADREEVDMVIQEFKEKLKNLGFKQDKNGKITLKFEPQAKVVKLGQEMDVKTSHLHWSEPKWWGRENHPWHPLRKPERPYVCRERRQSE